MRIILALLLAGSCTLALCPPDAAAGDLRLIEAVRTRNLEAARALVAEKVDVDAARGDGATALHWAAHHGDLQTIDLLIGAGAQVDAANDLGVTPLALACASGHADVVQRLLAAGADAHAAPGGEPVLMTAARTGSVEAVNALLARGADVNARETAQEQTALMWAVAHAHPDVVRLLLDHGADVSARSRVTRQVVQTGSRYGGVVSRERAPQDRGVVELPHGGSTPLLFAARSGDRESARLLVAAGADANDTAPDGTSALVLAAHSGHGAVAEYLLEAGADPNAAGAGYTALHAAVLRGDLTLVKALVARGADVDTRLMNGTASRRYSHDFAFNRAWTGATPFWLAARFAELDIMRFLGAKGADAKATTADNTTAALAAIAAGVDSGPSASDRRERRLDPVQLANKLERQTEEDELLRATVDLALSLGAEVNVANRAGDTPLHIAAAKGLPPIVRFLAGKGAALDAKNKRDQTPLALAMALSRSEPDERRRGGHPSRGCRARRARRHAVASQFSGRHPPAGAAARQCPAGAGSG